MKRVALAVALMGVMVSGCAWVKLDQGAEQVKVVNMNNLRGCQRMGWVEVAVRSEILFDIQRSPAKVQQELETLARNQAYKRGADSVIASGPVEKGKQNYDIYRCLR